MMKEFPTAGFRDMSLFSYKIANTKAEKNMHTHDTVQIINTYKKVDNVMPKYVDVMYIATMTLHVGLRQFTHFRVSIICS